LRYLLLISVCLLGGCGGGAMAGHEPGLDVARAALASGAPDIALRVTAEQLRRSPDNADALLLQGDALIAAGRTQEAAAAFHQVLALQPDSTGARLGLGRLALASDPPGAELLFLEVLAHDSRNGIALNDVGIARDLQGRHVQAQEAYRQALGVDPNMQAATVNLALSLALSGQVDHARKLLRPLAAAPDAAPRVRHDFALVSELAGDHVAAENALGADLSPGDLQSALKSYDALGSLAKPSR
jgi:Flp pilus assembly protein TadD